MEMCSFLGHPVYQELLGYCRAGARLRQFKLPFTAIGLVENPIVGGATVEATTGMAMP